MLDPLTLFMVGAGWLAFRELNKKDYGVLTAARDERYQNMMVNCYDPQALLAEGKVFAEHGLKAQAAMLKRRGEWRSRSNEVKKAHEDVFQKAIKSTNIAAILEVAAAFEGWTATKKAGVLRERARLLQEKMLDDVANAALKAKEKVEKNIKEEKTPQNTEVEEEEQEEVSSGPNGAVIPRNDSEPSEASDE